MVTHIHGFCDERFRPLKEAFRANFDAGLEVGASLAVTQHGKPVVDLWAGWMDAERTKPWQADTIVHVMSTTKVPMAIAAMRLVDRGLIDLDAPIARYWPEFAEGGKEGVTVRDAFCHCGGVPGFDPPVNFDVHRDWSKAIARLAATPHWFGGERQIMYHAHTYGFLLGEIVRRVDGRGPARFFREEIAEPAGIDFQMGLSDRADMQRVAHVAWPRPQGAAPPAGSVLARWIASLGAATGWDLMSWEGLSAEVPASVGLGNARSLARLASILADAGRLDDARYLSPEVVREAASEQAFGECPFFGWIRFGLGMALDTPQYPAPSKTAMHWGGTGGSVILADPAAGVAAGYTPNNWLSSVRDSRGVALLDAMQDILAAV
jgi:CubicO group peptidase (beta-lactamase class C family)